jgi:hypothetical protein
MKQKILTYILFLKYVKEEMTWDDCYALKERCKKQAEFYFYK